MSRLAHRSRSAAAARRIAFVAAVLAAALADAPNAASAALRHALPDSLTNREFWDLFTTLSEDGGSFPSENFVSNEQTFQHVIPTLQRTLTPGGVYLGVGPEQNFTYIANLEPRMAVIFDIRRQNAMAHLMYKALFELSATRADFVSRLFSRPLASVVPGTRPADLFGALFATSPSDSAFDANRKAIFDRLTAVRGFTLTPEDRSSITRVYAAFFEAGPNINYGYRSGAPRPTGAMYSTYAQLQALTNADGENMAFLANENNYRILRAMHQKNLIVPVVGNFAGPSAIRGVGDFLRKRGGTVTAFYLSNVEQYLFRQYGDAERFYRNVQTLPLDSTSTFIRSVPPSTGGFAGGPMGTFNMTLSASGTNQFSVQVADSAGVNVITTMTTDSTGRTVVTRSIDSGVPRRSAMDIFRALRSRDDSLARSRTDSTLRSFGVTPGVVFGRDSLMPNVTRNFYVGGGSLLSGLAPIRASLAAFDRGELRDYATVTAMTKTTGWNRR
jgi:hypothetical protein